MKNQGENLKMAMDNQPSTSNEYDFDSLTLHDMFRVVGDQMTPRAVKIHI